MDLVQEVIEHLSIDREDAEAALGAVLTAVRFGVDAKTFEELKDTIPESRALMSLIAGRSARTSEIVALATPETLARTLRGAGHSEGDIKQLGTILRNAVRRTIPSETAERIIAAIDRALP